MDIAGYLGELDRSGRRLAEAAKEAGLGAPVPTCPGWLIRDLLRHTGGVHRWATAFVSTGRAEPYGPDERRGFFTAPPDDGLLDWYLESHAERVRTLKDPDPDLECWAFLPAPSPLAFWARRQAHETAIHRVDAELAAGHAITPFDPAFAADGIDELLAGFYARPRGRLVADPPVSLAARATDHEAAWTIRIEPEGRTVTSGAGPADCVISGPAARLYVFLWNRTDSTGIDVQGDRRVLELWREKATIVLK